MRVCLRPLPLVELPSTEERRSSAERLLERVVDVGVDGPPLVMGMLWDVAVGDESGEMTFAITFLSTDIARKRVLRVVDYVVCIVSPSTEQRCGEAKGESQVGGEE